MKKILALTLALIMLFAFAACGNSPEDKVAKYVKENGDEIVASFDEGFAGSGMVYETEIKADGATIVLDVKISDFGMGFELDDATLELLKPMLQTAADEMQPEFAEEFEDMKEELPELENFIVNLCDKEGDLLVSFETNK